MADDAREYIRAAQAAELQGDKPRAIEFLLKAATLYKGAGNHQRALQMLRHARRLDGSRPELIDELSRMEWLPDRPLAKSVDEEEAETDQALGALDELAQQPAKHLVERGPTLADPALAAWCSFCCRPKSEVGDLVAGPAGAFICASCTRESQRLLKVETVAPQASAPAAPVPALPNAASRVEFVGQPEAVRILDMGMRMGARRILLLGPEGSGKTAYLRDAEGRGLGAYVSELSALDAIPAEQRLLIDLDAVGDPDRLMTWLRASPDRAVLVAARGQLPESALALKGDDGDLPLFSTEALRAATANRLPLEIAERVQIVVAFEKQSAGELVEVARRLLPSRAAELDVSEELLEALARAAAESERGGHELKALIDRIPPGSWNVKPAATPKKRRSKKKSSS